MTRTLDRSFRRAAFVLAGVAVAIGTGAAVAGPPGDGTVPAAATDAVPPHLLDLRAQPAITGDAQAGKALSAVCSACHGEAGIGAAPNFPNLAGQSVTYLYVQLHTFKGGQRNDPIMASMVLTLGDADMRDLAAYFSSLPPKQAKPPAEASPGARLFADGDPGRGIPPCQGCHGEGGRGPRAEGAPPVSTPRPPWATVPRLSGQSAAYVAKALQDFRGGARNGTSNAAIMHGVAATLGDEDIQAIADYLDGQ